MLIRFLLFIALLLLIALPLNWLAYRQLVRIHPRRKRWIVGVVTAGNLMWLFMPFLRTFSPVTRVARAVLAPVWFGWTSFTMVYALFLLIVFAAWLPFRRRRFSDFARWPSRVLLTALAIGFVIGYVQAIVPLRIEHVTIRTDSLPPSAAGTRIALLGDLHVGLFTRRSRLQRIFETTASLHPDVVAIAGDMIDDDPHFVPKLLAGARSLDPSTPLFGVFGNHEMYGDPYAVIEKLRGSRIRLLINEGVPFGDLWIAGVSDPAARELPGEEAFVPDVGKALAAKPPSAFPILLAHQPRLIDEARRHRIPVALVAHTHGGQLGIRPLGWSLAGVFLRHHMGYYDLAPTQLYINTGTGYWVFPFRLGMTPEITLIELQQR